jgi:predicted secreted hydrolase
LVKLLLLCCWLFGQLLSANSSHAAAPVFDTVRADQPLIFPADFGAHPSFRTEWWYVTGWLSTPDKKPLGFQITFFRSATEHDRANPSAFAPSQLIIAHVALSDPAVGKLLHDQRSARQGFGLVYAKSGETDVKLDNWRFQRAADGHYDASIAARDFTLQLKLQPTQPIMLQGENGFSRKGPQLGQASHYYSQPQLQVSGSLTRNAGPTQLTGSAWLDHEWSTSVLDASATGWDWLGANLDDGGALMAFQIRRADGTPLWAHATWREKSGKITQFGTEQVHFAAERHWRSPRTNANYPVASTILTGATRWRLLPLQDDQELDSRQSTGAVYWEGGVTILRDEQPVGHGYFELTGYVKPLKL